jgi:hypothetical protein
MSMFQGLLLGKIVQVPEPGVGVEVGAGTVAVGVEVGRDVAVRVGVGDDAGVGVLVDTAVGVRVGCGV